MWAESGIAGLKQNKGEKIVDKFTIDDRRLLSSYWISELMYLEV